MPLHRLELDGLILLQSPALLAAGAPHAFTTRGGGLSAPPFDTLNLGRATGDDPAAVRANQERVCRALGFGLPALRLVHQVHGCHLLAADQAGEADGELWPEADGLLLSEPGRLALVRTADCLPLLLARADGRAAAAVHAGWRGLAAGIVPRAVAALARQAGCRPGDLCAAVGPAIGPAAYEVGPEVAAAFDPAFRRPGADAGGRAHLDLQAAAAAQLAAAGVAVIDVAEECTWSQPELFFSHRRDGARTGRQGAVIACRARP
jgi:hypothetical protein